MSYVVYNIQSTRYLSSHRGSRTDKTHFASEAAAKSALTRAVNRTADTQYAINRADFTIAEANEFRKIEKMVTVTNLMSGKPVQQSINTPRCCDVSSELYWTM